MFTEQAQQLLDQAKTYAVTRKERELTLESVITATIQNAETRVLLTRCIDFEVEKLLEKYAIPTEPLGTIFGGKMALTQETQALLAQAKELAARVPDSRHPGLIGHRHIVVAMAISNPTCALMDVKAISEKAAFTLLASWYEDDSSIPELGDLTERMRTLRSVLLGKIFGQDHAVHAFVEGLFNAEVVAHADSARKYPQAVFVFAGPPGVGKTYLAESGALSLERTFKRFDMSSYSDHQQHMQLVGFPPAYQSAQPGLLTDFVAKNPGAFLLFDEIEKAHLNTIQLFLQILDAGRLEDKFTGEEVSFRDTVIIFTTNAGTSLYDRPNETGINAANNAFHRRTILDALRTEKDPHGEPFFPAAICSRLATGYPVLFNHLGVNELERIAHIEVQRVSSLIEQQYYKSVTFDNLLPMALVLREGANTDARTVRSQSGIFVRTELFKFSELYNRTRLEQVLNDVDSIHFELDPDERKKPEAISLFEHPAKPKILLVTAKSQGELFRRHIPLVDWIVTDKSRDALQILATAEVDMVLLDIWLGRDANAISSKPQGTIRQFDHVPLAAKTLAEGQDCLKSIHERLPALPVFLLSFTETRIENAGTVDEDLFLACVRGGGARGVLTTSFITDKGKEWEENKNQMEVSIKDIAQNMYREKKARDLGQERKVLAFDTVPNVDRADRRVTVRLRNLRLSRAVSAEDASELLEEVERPATRFDNVFGADAAKEALKFVVGWLRNPRRYAALGVSTPKGILLTGSPGTGKTMLARALAGESDVAFLVASGTDFVTIWQGSGPQNVRNLFARARRYAPAILFIDEIDAIGKKRHGGAGAGQAEESTLNALLTEIDGFGGPSMRPVILLAATNLADHLDDALLRRFDRVIEVQPPDRNARAAFLRHELQNRQLAQISDEVINKIAARSAGMTIANLHHVVNEATVMAVRKESPLTNEILEESFEKMRMGEAGKTPDEKTLERIARHEAGHALIGWLTGNKPVQVTIVGRGNAGGYVEKEVDEEKIIYTRGELEQMICQAMGGRAAELLYYGQEEGLSTGVASDLKNATAWAERMIREFGMSADIGQLYIDPRNLGDGPLAAKIGDATERVVHTQLDKSQEILKSHRSTLDNISKQLLTKNRLERSDLEKIFNSDDK
jgi:cell division protease FtsH